MITKYNRGRFILILSSRDVDSSIERLIGKISISRYSRLIIISSSISIDIILGNIIIKI